MEPSYVGAARKGKGKWWTVMGPDIGTRNITDMVAEPGSGSWPCSALERVQALERMVKDLTKQIKFLNSQVNENIGRSVLLSVKVNRIQDRLAEEKSVKEVDKQSKKTVAEEEKTVNQKGVKDSGQVNPDAIVSELVNIEGENVKVIIGPRGDRVNKIRENTGVQKIELNGDVKTFTVIGTAAQIQAARALMTEIAAGRLEGVQEISVITQFDSSRCRDIIGPKGSTVRRIQDNTRTHIELKQTLSKGVSQATVSGPAESVNDAVAGIQQIAATGQYKPSIIVKPPMPDASWITKPPGISLEPVKEPVKTFTVQDKLKPFACPAPWESLPDDAPLCACLSVGCHYRTNVCRGCSRRRVTSRCVCLQTTPGFLTDVCKVCGKRDVKDHVKEAVVKAALAQVDTSDGDSCLVNSVDIAVPDEVEDDLLGKWLQETSANGEKNDLCNVKGDYQKHMYPLQEAIEKKSMGISEPAWRKKDAQVSADEQVDLDAAVNEVKIVYASDCTTDFATKDKCGKTEAQEGFSQTRASYKCTTCVSVPTGTLEKCGVVKPLVKDTVVIEEIKETTVKEDPYAMLGDVFKGPIGGEELVRRTVTPTEFYNIDIDAVTGEADRAEGERVTDEDSEERRGQ